MGYLFCTMSSPEIIGSLIILSLWSRLKAQAHQGAETGAVFVVPLPVEPRGAAFPGGLGMVCGFLITQRQPGGWEVALPRG